MKEIFRLIAIVLRAPFVVLALPFMGIWIAIAFCIDVGFTCLKILGIPLIILGAMFAADPGRIGREIEDMFRDVFENSKEGLSVLQSLLKWGLVID